MRDDRTKKLFKCSLTGGGTFYVIERDETAARYAVEDQWRRWDYIGGKGRVSRIEVLAEEGQFPEVPDYNVTGPDTWLLVP